MSKVNGINAQVRDAHCTYAKDEDFDEILEIEQDCFGERAWDQQALLSWVRKPSVRAKVVTLAMGSDEVVAGFLLCQIAPEYARIINMAVDMKCQRQGLGSLLLARMHIELTDHPTQQLFCRVSERNLPMQCFLRSHGYKMMGVERDFWPNESAYEFRVHVGNLHRK